MSSRIVCAVGVPHVPVFPQMVVAGNQQLQSRYGTVLRALSNSDPSLLVVVASDHLNFFFLDRVPTFSIAIGDILRGPIDSVGCVAERNLSTDPAAAGHLADSLICAGFDLLRSQETEFDHAVAVPLYFLNPHALPVVALNLNAYVTPLPNTRRCYDLGVALSRAVESLPRDHRVAVIASGSFSQEVGGPRVGEGRAWSVPRPDWALRVSERFAHGATEELLAAATPEILRDAGSVAGEVLSWIVMAGAAEAKGAGLHGRIDYHPGEAYAFGIWQR